MGQTSNDILPTTPPASPGVANLAELQKEMDAAQAKMKQESKDAFSNACKEVFEQHQKLESFSWTQYSPFFNDGDACEFGVHEIGGLMFDGVEWDSYELNVKTQTYTKMGEEPVEEKDYRGVVHKRMRAKYEYVNHEPRISGDGDDPEIPEGFDMLAACRALEAIRPIHQFMQSNRNLAEAAFGNHVKVIVSRAGVDVEEYGDHD